MLTLAVNKPMSAKIHADLLLAKNKILEYDPTDIGHVIVAAILLGMKVPVRKCLHDDTIEQRIVMNPNQYGQWTPLELVYQLDVRSYYEFTKLMKRFVAMEDIDHGDLVWIWKNWSEACFVLSVTRGLYEFIPKSAITQVDFDDYERHVQNVDHWYDCTVRKTRVYQNFLYRFFSHWNPVSYDEVPIVMCEEYDVPWMTYYARADTDECIIIKEHNRYTGNRFVRCRSFSQKGAYALSRFMRQNKL